MKNNFGINIYKFLFIQSLLTFYYLEEKLNFIKNRKLK